MRLPDFFQSLAAAGSVLVFVLANVAMAQNPAEPVGVSPTRDDPKQFSLDEDNIGWPSLPTPVDADDLSTFIPGIDGMAYIYQTFQSAAVGLVPSPPVGLHNAVLNPWDLGLRRNVLQPGAPRQTHKDQLNALSYGNDLMYLDGQLVGFPGFTGEPPLEPFKLRQGFSDTGEPRVDGRTRANVEFSVDVHAQGLPGTGVAGTVGPFPLKPSSHVFVSRAAGTNSVLYSDVQLGVFQNDDVDAYENVPSRLPALQHPDQLGMPAGAQPSRVYFSVDNETQGHNPALSGRPNAVNTQAGLGEASGDVFVGIGGGNLLLIDEGQLGLWPGLAVPGFGFDDADDLDALALNILIPDVEARIEQALASFDPASPDTGYGITIPLLKPKDAAVLFSVEEGSIGLLFSAVDWEHRIDPSEESGDLFFSNLTGQNWRAYEAMNLGLLESDELNALDTAAVPEPSTMAMLAALGLLGSLGLVRKRRRAV